MPRLLAHLCGGAPIPASSGRTDRHRLNRSGDRAANNALHPLVLSRLRYDPRTQQHAARHTQHGLGKKEIIRTGHPGDSLPVEGNALTTPGAGPA